MKASKTTFNPKKHVMVVITFNRDHTDGYQKTISFCFQREEWSKATPQQKGIAVQKIIADHIQDEDSYVVTTSELFCSGSN